MPQVLSALTAISDARRMPASLGSSLRPFIFGPRAGLHRYAKADEKTTISLGAYDAVLGGTYSYPGKATGSIIDLDYVKLFADDAYLKYFDRLVGGVGTTITIPAGYPNRITASGSLTFKSSTNAIGTSYPRTAGSFYDRDVAIGDIVRLRATVSAVEYDEWTSVIGFIHTPVAASVSSATSDTDNPATQSNTDSDTKLHGASLDNKVRITPTTGVDSTTYNGIVDGDINETYTITCIQSSSGNDATTALLNVRSGSGRDDVASVAPAAFASPTTIGTRGLTVTWDDLGSAGTNPDVDNFLEGQQWLVTVSQAFTKPTPTSGGTPAAGMPTTTYVVTVTSGGFYASGPDPEITVSTTTGVDISGPTAVTAAATPFAIGNYGVTIQFSGTALRKGDKYYVPVVGAQDGAIKTLVLNNSMPTGMLAATDINVQLFIPHDGLEITKNRLPSPPSTNWTATSTDFTVESGITVYDSTWTNAGTLMALPLSHGDLYLEYREWLTDMAGEIIDIYDITTVGTVIGKVDPDNPLAYGVYKALQNTAFTNFGGTPQSTDVVRCASIAGDPDLAPYTSWSNVLYDIEGQESLYNIVPLTYNATVKGMVSAHVTAQSAAELGHYRAAIFAMQTSEYNEIRMLDDNEDVITATLIANPDDGNSYTKLYDADGLAKWITAGVQAGDTVRYLFTTDGFGTPTWTEFTVASVEAEDIIYLESGTASAVNTPEKVEVIRYESKADMITDLSNQADDFDTSRVLCVWPDTINSGGVVLPGYYACAALAGLIGSVLPHQGLTNVELLGFDAVPRSLGFFNNSQMDALANAGIAVISQIPSGVAYVRKCWTSDPATINSREEMVRRDMDAICSALLTQWSQYIGSANNTPSTLTTMQGDFTSVIGSLRASSFTNRLGSMVESGSLSDIRPHTVLADTAVVTATIVGPFPLNQIQITLTV